MITDNKDAYCEFKALTQKIADFKKKNHLTYQQIAESIGVDKSHVHRVVNMETSPSLKFLLRLSRYMKIPLFSLFIPSKDIVGQDIAEKIEEGLTQFNLTFEQLTEKVHIPTLRLMDITKGNTIPTPDEYQAIATVLDLDQNDWLNSTEVKINLIKTTLLDLGFNEDQLENVLEYIHNIVD